MEFLVLSVLVHRSRKGSQRKVMTSVINLKYKLRSSSAGSHDPKENILKLLKTSVTVLFNSEKYPSLVSCEDVRLACHAVLVVGAKRRSA